jgi:hypothetical protein
MNAVIESRPENEDLFANVAAILFGLCSLIAGGIVFASTL